MTAWHLRVSVAPPRPGPSRGLRASTRAPPARPRRAVALGLSELIGAVLPGTISLIAAVGQVVIDRQHTRRQDLVVALFVRTTSWPSRYVVVLASLLLVRRLGVLAARRFWVAAAGFAAFGVVGFLATLGDPLANPALIAGQTVVSVGLAVQNLSWLLAQVPSTSPEPGVEPDRTRPPPLLLRTAAVGRGLVAGIGGRSLPQRVRAPADRGDRAAPASEPVAAAGVGRGLDHGRPA